MPSPAVIMMMGERSMLSAAVKSAATISPTESEIATLAYQLWQDNGCPVRSDKEDWFLAKALLKGALLAKRQDLPRRPPVPRDDSRPEFEMLAEFPGEGHWVVWESEWAGPRWIRDLGTSGAKVLTGV
jgi:Protein of unknown function (DUF2934)